MIGRKIRHEGFLDFGMQMWMEILLVYYATSWK